MDSTSSPKDPMVDFVVKEFERYEKHWQPKFQKCRKIYDHWIGKPPRRDFDWQNAVHVPMMIEAEQTITPRIFSALMPTEAPLDVLPFGETPEEDAIVIKNTISNDFIVSNVQGKALLPLTQCSLYGTGYMEAYWNVERKWQINNATKERYQAIVANRPDCRPVNFFEIFPHPAKIEVDDGLPLIRRQFCDAEYLKGLAENPYWKFEKINDALNSESVVKQSSIVLGTDGKPMDTLKREEYEMLSYWGGWDVSYKKEKEVVTRKAVPHWIIVINRSVCIYGVPNPYNFQHAPIIRFKMFEDAEPSWFGVGMGEIGIPSQERINKMVNQRLDNVDLVLNKQGFYNGNDTMINTKKLQVSKPGLWHKVSDTVTSIRWMETPDVTASSYKEEELAKNDFRESTGATVPLMPTDEGQHRTAMGINLLQGAAGMRFKPVLRRLEIDFIQNLAQMYLSMRQQFMLFKEWIILTSEDGKRQPIEITPEQIQAKIKFIPTGISETLNKEVEIGQLLRFKELSVQDPTVNRAEINKRIAELMRFKDIQKLLTPPQTITQGPGQLAPSEQQLIQQRLAEGATPEQIKLELLGQPPQIPTPEDAGMTEAMSG